jgi:hypothetical protein
LRTNLNSAIKKILQNKTDTITSSAAIGRSNVAQATLLVKVVITTAIIDTNSTNAHGGRNWNQDKKAPIAIDNSETCSDEKN